MGGPRKVTIIAAALKWVGMRRSLREIQASTAENYRSILIGFAQTVGMERPLGQVTRKHVEGWFAEQSGRGIAASTISFRYVAIRSFFRWAVDTGQINRSPCDGIKGPRRPQSQPRAMPPETIAATLAACPDARARLVVTLMVQEGLRTCEVQRLETGDIDTLDGVMLVKGKGNKERWLPITSETLAAMDAYLAEYPPVAGPLIRSYQPPFRGLSVDRIGMMVREAMQDAGVKKRARDGRSAHALRHTFARDLLAGQPDAGRPGVDVEDLRLALGHEDLSSTAIYVKRLRASGRLREGMEGRDYRVAGASGDV